MTEKFFIGKPDLDTARPQMREGLGGQKPQAVITYEDAMGYSMIWSAAFGLPAVGETVFVTMNDIGYAVVAGYFVSILDDGTAYLGIMEKTLCPPEWMVRQRASNPGKTDWQRAGIGCIFGTECRPLAAGEVVPSVAELQAERRKKAAAWKRKVAKQRKAERAEQEARWAADAAEKAADAISLEITVDAALAEPAPLHKSGLTAEEIHAERAASALLGPEAGETLGDWFNRVAAEQADYALVDEITGTRTDPGPPVTWTRVPDPPAIDGPGPETDWHGRELPSGE